MPINAQAAIYNTAIASTIDHLKFSAATFDKAGYAKNAVPLSYSQEGILPNFIAKLNEAIKESEFEINTESVSTSLQFYSIAYQYLMGCRISINEIGMVDFSIQVSKNYMLLLTTMADGVLAFAAIVDGQPLDGTSTIEKFAKFDTLNRTLRDFTRNT